MEQQSEREESESKGGGAIYVCLVLDGRRAGGVSVVRIRLIPPERTGKYIADFLSSRNNTRVW